MSIIGDGKCDAEASTSVCDFDKGDCSSTTLLHIHIFTDFIPCFLFCFIISGRYVNVSKKHFII